MKIKSLIFGLFAIAAAVSCTGNKADKTASPVGVWANADCEFLRTEHFALLFERADSVITATLHYMEDGDTILLGKTAFGKDSVLMQYVRKEGDQQEAADLGTLQADGSLHVAINGREQRLEKIEEIAVVEPYEMLHASPLEIASCIRQWCLGTKGGYNDGESVWFEAGTNGHSYTFNIQPQMIYCRAARMGFNDHGVLFSQNIRLMANPREQTCEMPEDNRALSSRQVVIDNTKFSPDQCVFDKEGIYWSFIGFEQDTALLNGCGEVYRFDRPGKESLVEWIAFEKN